MRLNRTTTLIAALLGALSAYACRPSLEVACDGECGGAGGAADGSAGAPDELGAGAGAEAGGQGGAHVGGQGGVPDVQPKCRDDGDCADGTFCNGVETCQAGACEPGATVECAPQTACSEDEDGAGAGCRFSSDERFYLCSGDDFGEPYHAVGFPLTQSAPIPYDFSQGVIDGEFKIYLDTWDRSASDYAWSPDGRRVVFPSYVYTLEWDTYEEKFFYFDIGAPVEGQPRRLPNIPINTDYLRVASWSADGSALVLGNYDWSEGLYNASYVVRFSEAGAESAALPTQGLAFICADNATVALNVGQSTLLFQPWQPDSEEVVLPMNTVSISPDGKTLLLSDDAFSTLAPCSLDTELETLGGFGSPSVVANWSSDSRYVVVGDKLTYVEDEPSLTHLLGYSVASENAHGVLFEATAVDPHVLFEPGSARFVYVTQAEGGEPTWHATDLDDMPSDIILPIPPDVGTLPEQNDYVSGASWLGRSGALSFTTEDLGRVALPIAASAKPHATRGVFSEDGASELWVEQEVVEGVTYSQAYSLAWAENGALPRPLFDQPFEGTLFFLSPHVLASYDAESESTVVYSLPPGSVEPVKLNLGKDVLNCSLQPQR